MKKRTAISLGLIVLTTFLTIFMKWDSFNHKNEGKIIFSEELTLKQIATKNDLPLKELLHVLSHENHEVWSLPNDAPLWQINIEKKTISDAIQHIKEEESPFSDAAKIIIYSILLSIVLSFVLTRKKIQKFRKTYLLIVALIFGFLLGSSPNPMESTVKLFKLFNDMEDGTKYIIISFAIFSLFSIIGNKMFCSWGCPLGALQETIYNFSFFKKKIRIPFASSLTSRIIFFVLFIIFLFGIGISVANFVIYHQFNYFKLFNFHDIALVALWTSPILGIASLIIFRPFCQYICPFSLYSWTLEKVSLNKIKIDDKKCIKCKKCIVECPTTSMAGIYNKGNLLPDCWSCGRCIEVCPVDAITYSDKQ